MVIQEDAWSWEESYNTEGTKNKRYMRYNVCFFSISIILFRKLREKARLGDCLRIQGFFKPPDINISVVCLNCGWALGRERCLGKVSQVFLMVSTSGFSEGLKSALCSQWANLPFRSPHPLYSRAWAGSAPEALATEHWGQVVIEDLVFLHVLCYQVSIFLSERSNIFPSLSFFSLMYVKKFFVPFISPDKFNSIWAFAFLTWSLAAWIISL